MSEQRSILVETANTVFTQALTHGFAPIEQAGFPLLLIAEERGGFGGDWGDLFAVMRVAGEVALAEPVGETMIAAKLMHDRGDVVRNGPLPLYATLALHPTQDRHLGALLRVAQSAGALDAALAMSIEHTNTRVQFGKPLSKQQAVQQSLATFAVEVAAVNVAGAAAAAALDRGEALFEIAAAKVRTNRAIGVGTAIAHQVHGAIGFTMDYPLHRLTRSLMIWRSEFGNDAYWSAILGGLASTCGGAGLWTEITRRGDR